MGLPRISPDRLFGSYKGGKELRRHIGRAALMRFVDLTHVYREPIVRRVERGRLRVLRPASDRAFSGNAYP